MPETTAEPAASAATAPTTSPSAASTVPTGTTGPAPDATGGGASGTVLGDSFKAMSAFATKTTGDAVVVAIYDEALTCANVAAKNFGTRHLQVTTKWAKGAKSTSISAYPKESIGKTVNYDKKGTAEATVVDATDKGGKLHIVAKDPGLKVDFTGDVDVVRCP